MSELPILDDTDQRILGSLLEKQTTVPASYPLTANALRTACNQSNNRDPVVDLDEQTVEARARALKDRGLLRIVWAATGRRTLKYHQTLEERLRLEPDERALLTVLLLRGPQAAGELRTRTERLHPFVDRGDVEACLLRMAARPEPLVRELERRPGQQDARWVHRLGPVPPEVASPSTAAGPAPVDRETVIAEGGEARDARVRSSYDAVASDYAEHLFNELQGLPFESWLLDRVVAHAAGSPVVEVGCGPGHVTAHLADRGADARGVDLSPAMIEVARRRFPGGASRSGTSTASTRRRGPRAGRPCWGGTPWSTSPPPSCPAPSPPWPVRSSPEAGWSSGCTPARRCATWATGSSTRSTWTSCCTSRPRWLPRSRGPGWWTSSGISAGRSPPGTRPPSVSTRSAAGPARWAILRG